MKTDRRRKIAARLIRSDDQHDQAVGWQVLRFLRTRYPRHPENITEPRGGPLPEVRPGIYANTEDPAFLAALEPRKRIPRDCFTCAHSPKWRGPGTPAGCDAMSLDEHTDGPILDFCEAAEVSEEPHPGWPSKTADCPAWAKR